MAVLRRVRPGLGAGGAALAAILLLAAARPLVAQVARASDSEVEAAFLLNFAQFVDWPAEAFPEAQSTLVICVLGDDPFGAVLDATVRGERKGERAIEVRRHRTVEEIGTCHILFIGRSESSRLDQIRTTLRSRAILTVSDLNDFAARGGMIGFVNLRNRIRLQINVRATRGASLDVSSKLLRLADIIGGGA